MLKKAIFLISLLTVSISLAEMLPAPSPVAATPAANCSTVIGFGFCQVLYDQCLNVCNSSCLNQVSLYPGHLEGELRDCRNKCRDHRENCIDNRIFSR